MRTRPDGFSDSPNARSKSITTAEGVDTFGVRHPPHHPASDTPIFLHPKILNRHAAKNLSYQVGVSEDKGTRRTMEDAHSFVVDFGGVRGQGFFAVFDGHAGKHAAEWCGGHFHEVRFPALPLPISNPTPSHSCRPYSNLSIPHPQPPSQTSSTKLSTTSTSGFPA
jgi:protein phosphatase PTC1